jgi:ATPase involved in DNA replication initiation
MDPGEPVSIQVLAEIVAEGRRVDLRIAANGHDGYTLDYCQLVELRLRPHDEDIVCRRVVNKGKLGEKPSEEFHTVNAQQVRWIRPTQTHPLEVESLAQPARGDDQRSADDQWDVVDAIERSVGFLHKVKLRDLKYESIYKNGALYSRQVAMQLCVEMTTLSTRRIAERFGYQSPTPVWGANYRSNELCFREDVRRAAKLIDERLGRCYRPHRRDTMGTILVKPGTKTLTVLPESWIAKVHGGP